MASFQGLYYPYIHFQDEGWLKSAMLYWDSMARVVPDGAEPSDSFTVRVFAREGIVINESPSREAYKIAEPFRRLLTSHGARLQKKFGVGSIPERDLSLIHDMKFDQRLANDLLALKLAQCHRNKWGDTNWIGVHPQLARVYMTALAEEMAPAIGARPVVDNAIDHVSVSGLTLERLIDLLFGPDKAKSDSAWSKWWLFRGTHAQASAKREATRQAVEIEQAMATLAFRYAVPANPESIPVGKIIDFRNGFKEERGLFQTEVTKIAKELDYLQEVKDADDFSRHLKNEYEKRLKPRVERLEKGMRDANWDIAESAIAASYGVPAGVAAAIGALTIGLPPELGAGIGIAFAGWKLWRKREKDEANVLKPSAEAYLYRVKKALSPAALANEIKVAGSKA